MSLFFLNIDIGNIHYHFFSTLLSPNTGEWTLSAREAFATFNTPDASLLSVFSAVQERRQSLLAADAPPLKSASQHQRHIM